MASVALELNKARNPAAARTIGGAVLKTISGAYQTSGKLSSSSEAAARAELDRARSDLEAAYRALPAEHFTFGKTGQIDDRRWDTYRRAVDRALVVVAGINGQAGHRPQTTNLQILGTSLAEAPSVFASAVGKTAGTIGRTAGDVAGGALSGIAQGLGAGWSVLLVVVGLLAALIYLRPLLGPLLGGAR